MSKQLLEYGVEYNVLQEELATPRPEAKKLKQMEEMNRALMEKNKSLTEQLEVGIFYFGFCYTYVNFILVRIEAFYLRHFFSSEVR